MFFAENKVLLLTFCFRGYAICVYVCVLPMKGQKWWRERFLLLAPEFFPLRYMRMRVLVSQLCLTLCDPMECSPPGFSVHGILQASIPQWVAIPFSKGSSWPWDWTWVCLIAGRSFTIWDSRETFSGDILVIYTRSLPILLFTIHKNFPSREAMFDNPGLLTVRSKWPKGWLSYRKKLTQKLWCISG